MSTALSDSIMGRPTKPLVLTLGEPAGISPEITLKAWLNRQALALSPFYIIAPPSILKDTAASLKVSVPIVEITDVATAADVFARALPVLPLALDGQLTIGKPNSSTGQVVIDSIRLAVAHVMGNQAAAVVTNPIQKSVLYDAGFQYPGHTEYLADLCNAPLPVMMLAIPELRVVPLTVHIPLAHVSAALTHDHIVKTARIVDAALKRDFAILKPRLAVAGLNPHAGEDGRLGAEDLMTITPAIEQLKAEGISIEGPYPADSMFHATARARYDVALCAYHDQALIPLKTIDFDRGVNVTLGLPIVRTSPDHGTATNIAGQGIANPSSLIEAIKLATTMANARAQHNRDTQ